MNSTTISPIFFVFWQCNVSRRRHIPTIKRIPDELWCEIKLILPQERQNNTIGRPVVQFREVLDVHIMREGIAVTQSNAGVTPVQTSGNPGGAVS